MTDQLKALEDGKVADVITHLLLRTENIEKVLGTVICWLIREFGEHGVIQLLDEIENGKNYD